MPIPPIHPTFGHVPEISGPELLTGSNLVLQFGLPPNRIDLMTEIEGTNFEDVWQSRIEQLLDIDPDPVPVYYIGLEQLILNKRTTGRPKDQEDLRFLTSIARSTDQSSG